MTEAEQWKKDADVYRQQANAIQLRLADKCAELERLKGELETSEMLVKGLEGNLKACEEELESTTTALETERARSAALRKMLEQHHAWHLEACEIPTDLAEAYVESEMCIKTCECFKPDYAPTPPAIEQKGAK